MELLSSGATPVQSAPIVVGQVFDIAEAWRLRDVLERSDPKGSVLIDFSRVREFHDFALVVLVGSLAKAPHPAFGMRGLGQHQQAILRYFGMDLEAR